MIETLTGKRGSGKTFKAFERLKELALAQPHRRLAFIGPLRMEDVLSEYGFPEDRVKKVSKTSGALETDNDSVIYFRRDGDIESLRGMRFDGIVADATDVWKTPIKSMEHLSASLFPDGVLIETRFE